jgi:hypothetical protein
MVVVTSISHFIYCFPHNQTKKGTIHKNYTTPWVYNSPPPTLGCFLNMSPTRVWNPASVSCYVHPQFFPMVFWFWYLVPSAPNYLEVIPRPHQPPSLPTCLPGKTCSREEVSGNAFMVWVSKFLLNIQHMLIDILRQYGMHAYVLDMKEIIDLASLHVVLYKVKMKHRNANSVIDMSALCLCNRHEHPLFVQHWVETYNLGQSLVSFSLYPDSHQMLDTSFLIEIYFPDWKIIWCTYFNRFSKTK